MTKANAVHDPKVTVIKIVINNDVITDVDIRRPLGSEDTAANKLGYILGDVMLSNSVTLAELVAHLEKM